MRHIVAALVLAALAGAGCGGGGGTAQQGPSVSPTVQAPGAGGDVVVVKMSEFKYDISPADVPAGRVTFRIENVGAVEHSFVVEDLGIRTEQIRPGQTVTVSAALKPGTYKAHCDVAGHTEAGMALELTVR